MICPFRFKRQRSRIMPPVTNCRKSISIESIINAPKPSDLVQLIRKNRGLGRNPIIFNDSESENQRGSFPLNFLDDGTAVPNIKKSLEQNGIVSDIENQSVQSSAENNKVIEVFPTRGRGHRVKVKRLRESLARRSLIRDMERTPITSIFHQDAASTTMQQFGVPDATSTPNQGVNDNANKNTIKQTVSIQFDATKHHQTEKSIEPKSTGNAANLGTQYFHESIEISGEVDRTVVNEIQGENEAHLGLVSHQNPANHAGVNKTHNSILESNQPNSAGNLLRSRTTGQRSQIARANVQEVQLVTRQKIGQHPDSSVINSTLTKNIRRSEEKIKNTISVSKIPRRVVVSNGEPNKSGQLQAACKLLSPGRSSVVVIPIYPPPCHSNKKDEQCVEQLQQYDVNATRKNLTKKVTDQSLISSDQHVDECSLTTPRPLPEIQIISDEDSSDANQEIPLHQCSPLRQVHSNRVKNFNCTAGNLREKSNFDVAIVETLNQHQAESDHMGHSSSEVIDLRLSCRRSSKLPASHEESRHNIQLIPSTGKESSSDSESSLESIAKINEVLSILNNDYDSIQRHEIRAKQHQLPELVEKFTNRENTVSPSDRFNPFEGVTGRESRSNVFDLSPHREKLGNDLMTRKETTAANRKETAGAGRSLFNRRRGKRVVSEIVPKQSQTLFEEIQSSLRKSNRRNSNRNRKRKLTIGNRSENQSLVSEQHRTNSPICKIFGFFQPIVLGAAHKKPESRNLKHAKTTRIDTAQKLLDSWRPESEKRQHGQQPKESLGNEEEEPIFKVIKPPTRRKPVRTKLPAKKAGDSSSLTNSTAVQTSASKKSSRSTDQSNKTFESKANQQCNDRFTNFRNDENSSTTETSIQNGYRKYSRTADRTTTNTKSKSKSLQRQRSQSATRVSFAKVSDDDQIDSVLAGTANKSKQPPLTRTSQQEQNNTVNSQLQSNKSPEMRRRKAYDEITGIELIQEIPSVIVPPPPKKLGRPRKSIMKSVERTLPTPISARENSPETIGPRRSARKHHAPRPYWTNNRDCFPIVEVNYKEPDIKESRKRQPNKMKKKLEMIPEMAAVTDATDLSDSKKIADDLFDALKELSQTNDPSINTIRCESVAVASVSREDSSKLAKSKRPRKNTKNKTAVVAKSTTSTTVVDSGIQSSDQEGANPQGNTTASNNCLLSWLQHLVGTQTISSHPDLHRVFKLAEVTIVPLQHLIFSSINGVDYAYYDKSFPDSEHYGYMRFNPHSTKPIARTKKFELRFLSIVGELSLTIDENSVRLTGGAFITIPKGVKYSLANRSDETALIFFIKT